MSIKEQEFLALQEELIRLKEKHHELTQVLNSSTNSNSSFLHSFFSSGDNSGIDKLQKEETELKRLLLSIAEQNETMKGEFKIYQLDLEFETSSLESLLSTRKRELERMHEMNKSMLADLEEEVELARDLCESLENGKTSLVRDKESLDNSIFSLSASIETSDKQIVELKEIIANMEKELDKSDDEDYSQEISSVKLNLQSLNEKIEHTKTEFEEQKRKSLEIRDQKLIELENLKKEYKINNAADQENLKKLRKELQALQNKSASENPTSIDIDSLRRENTDLRERLEILGQQKEILNRRLLEIQTDSAYLAEWLKKETRPAANVDSAFSDIIRIHCNLQETTKNFQKN